MKSLALLLAVLVCFCVQADAAPLVWLRASPGAVAHGEAVQIQLQVQVPEEDTQTYSNMVLKFTRPAEFEWGSAIWGAPVIYQFTNKSQTFGHPPIWQWSFGDGLTSTEESPAHAYTGPGSYTVSLTVTTAGGTDTETKPGFVQVQGIAPSAGSGASVTIPVPSLVPGRSYIACLAIVPS